MMRDDPGRLEWWMAALVAPLPFDLLQPSLAGGRLTLLQGWAALCALVVIAHRRAELPRLLKRPGLPLCAAAAWAAANLASALLAEVNPLESRASALRTAVALLAALACALAPPSARGRALAALVAATAVAALLAVGEGLGLRALDPVLDRFRIDPFVVRGARRATAGSENPNLAAAFLVYGLAALAAGVLALRRAATLLLALLLVLGLLFTYSRGGLVAAAAAVAVLRVLQGRPLGRPHLLTAGAALAAGVLAFALAVPTFRFRLATEWEGFRVEARYQPAEPSLALHPGETRRLAVRITNSGEAAWPAGDQYLVAHRWFDRRRARELPSRWIRLPAPVAPGGSLEVQMDVEAPREPGVYVLVWDMVRRGRGTFSSFGVPPGAVAVAVGPQATPPPPDALPERALRRGRWEMWRIALDMARDHPILGVGADNYRWLRPSYGRWPVPGEFTTRADSVYLEALADSGLLGLAALTGWLAATGSAAARALRRQWRSEVAAAAAIVAAMAVHGVVDAQLVFSGHAILLGVLTGLVRPPAVVIPGQAG